MCIRDSVVAALQLPPARDPDLVLALLLPVPAEPGPLAVLPVPPALHPHEARARGDVLDADLGRRDRRVRARAHDHRAVAVATADDDTTAGGSTGRDRPA